uniref:Uncharacterized protein n=1 Tax=viral metagenome TaxID=1070528 RepID=A0A6M3ITA7_9ZZZZ
MNADKLREVVEIAREMERECHNEIDNLGNGKVVYNAPAIFSYERNYKEVLQILIDLTEQILSVPSELPKDFEDFLMEKHGEQYIGTDDMMPDDFNKWLEDLEIDSFIKYGNKVINLASIVVAKKNMRIEELSKALRIAEDIISTAGIDSENADYVRNIAKSALESNPAKKRLER